MLIVSAKISRDFLQIKWEIELLRILNDPLLIFFPSQVSVFGFGADQYGNWYHYWEDNSLAGAFRHTGVHDGDYEYNVTLLLADKHKIQMFKGR